VEDWAAHNPPNTGVNWKCGQEIAMRMFALVSGYAAFQDAEATSEDRAELLAEIVFTLVCVSMPILPMTESEKQPRRVRGSYPLYRWGDAPGVVVLILSC